MITKADNEKNILLEIRMTELWIKDLESLIKKHKKSVSTAETARRERITSLQCEYASPEEAHNAYGYDYITFEEYEAVVEFYEDKKDMEFQLEDIEKHSEFLKRELSRERKNLEYHKKTFDEIMENKKI